MRLRGSWEPQFDHKESTNRTPGDSWPKIFSIQTSTDQHGIAAHGHWHVFSVGFLQATGGLDGQGRGEPSKLLLRLGVLAVRLPNFRGDSDGKSVEAAVEASDKTPGGGQGPK